MARRETAQLRADAVDAVTAALQLVDIDVADVRADGPFDAALEILVDGGPITILLEYKAYCTGETARALTRDHAMSEGHASPLVVAERITAEARSLLGDAGWSWLDRRGRLHLRLPGVRVDLDVPPSTDEPSPNGPAITGRSGLAVAYWLLDHPGRALSPTGQRTELGLAPSTISVTVRRLSEAGLVSDDGRAVVPELFWELAGPWRSERAWLIRTPEPSNQPPADPEAPIWRRTGSAAAAAWGAPIVTGAGGPVELYVPGPVHLSIARRRYGAAEPGTGTAVLAVAPAPPVCAGLGSGADVPLVEGWPTAPKLAVALDLAQDRARGREILAEWVDGDGVWR